MQRRSFGSDNHAGIHPTVLAAIERTNTGDALAYGHDDYSTAVAAKVAALFGAEAQAFFVFNGTGANLLAIRSACRPYQAVICAGTAHINTDECGAPERIAGVKLVTLPTPDGKLTPALIERGLGGRGDEHRVQPRLVSISQATELGTCYSVTELTDLSRYCRERGLLLHIDGARLANAAASLGVGLGAAATGADLVSFGGTKNGLLAGEAIVTVNPALAEEMLFLRKQSLQLASKMRFFAAQFDAYLTDDLWLRNARHANAMAALLAAEVSSLPGFGIVWPTEANGVFTRMPAALVEPLQREYFFYLWDETIPVARLMCHFNTTEEEVRRFADLMRTESGKIR